MVVESAGVSDILVEQIVATGGVQLCCEGSENDKSEQKYFIIQLKKVACPTTLLHTSRMSFLQLPLLGGLHHVLPDHLHHPLLLPPGQHASTHQVQEVVSLHTGG